MTFGPKPNAGRTMPEGPNYRLTKRADADVLEIAKYTIARFGVEQSRRYRDDLAETFAALSKNPQLGRAAEHLAPGLRRWEHESHVIFYMSLADGVLVVRVLHRNMDVQRHSMADS